MVDSKEVEIQRRMEKELDGTHEPCPAGVVDIVTDTEIIEIKEWKQWKHALGQLLAYSTFFPGKRKRCHFFGKKPEGQVMMISDIMSKFSIEITVEPYVTKKRKLEEKSESANSKVEEKVELKTDSKEETEITSKKIGIDEICSDKESKIGFETFSNLKTLDKTHAESVPKDGASKMYPVDGSVIKEFVNHIFTILPPDKINISPDLLEEFIIKITDAELSEDKFSISLEHMSRWLGVRYGNIARLLNDSFSKKSTNYTEGADWIKKQVREKGTHKRKDSIFVSIDCFKNLCLRMHGEKTNMLRTYFILVERAYREWFSTTVYERRKCKIPEETKEKTEQGKEIKNCYS